MQNKLREILNKTKNDLANIKIPTRSFIKAIKNPKNGSIAIIAEIKLSSPTQSFPAAADEIPDRVKQYEQAGADCISVVTEKHFFKGDSAFVGQIKSIVSLPVLQKDFIIDPYQIYEAKIAGADAVLLIAKILSKHKLISLVDEAKRIGLEVVVEINNQDDLKKALITKTKIIAVNARSLDTFEVNIDKACTLLKKIPNLYIKLGFSGVSKKVDVEKYKNAGANGILIGTSLMKTKNIPQFLERIRI